MQSPDIIEINYDKLLPEVSKFIEYELDKCRRNNIKIYVPKARHVPLGQGTVAGYFDDENQIFAVAYYRSINHWLPVFVHETCHMDQWLEQIPEWNVSINGIDAMELLEDWLSLTIELDQETKATVFKHIIDIELDCERRSVEKIKKYNLPINIQTYIKKSNAYVWSYRLVQQTRVWEHSAAYEFPKVWRKMPAHFDNEYNILPDNISQIFYAEIENITRR